MTGRKLNNGQLIFGIDLKYLNIPVEDICVPAFSRNNFLPSTNTVAQVNANNMIELFNLYAFSTNTVCS